MKNQHSDTAILVFTRSLDSESIQKRLSNNQNAKIIHKLIEHTKDTVKKSCLPYFISSDEYQYGNSFGERLFNEMIRVFNSGYEKIIVIGNDSPELTSQTLSKVSSEITDKNLVLGPSDDGGVYLIGIHRKNLNRHLFINLPWLSDRVFKSFNEYSESQELKLINLDKLGDIDNEDDLKKHLSRNPIDKLSLSINSILASNSQYYSEDSKQSYAFDIIGLKQLRAPPTMAN